MNTPRFLSIAVMATVTFVVVLLAQFNVIEWWVGCLIVIGTMFVRGYIALIIARLFLGSKRFTELVVRANLERVEREKTKTKTRRI